MLNDLAQTIQEQNDLKKEQSIFPHEVRFKLDEKGKPIGIVVKESKESHQLIEEFMLLANKTVAEYVSKIKVNKKEVPFPYRVHDTPDEEKLAAFYGFCNKSMAINSILSSPEKIAPVSIQCLKM